MERYILGFRHQFIISAYYKYNMPRRKHEYNCFMCRFFVPSFHSRVIFNEQICSKGGAGEAEQHLLTRVFSLGILAPKFFSGDVCATRRGNSRQKTSSR